MEVYICQNSLKGTLIVAFHYKYNGTPVCKQCTLDSAMQNEILR